MSCEIELGVPYEFNWLGRTLTGVAISHKGGWVRLKTKKTSFSVPELDVLRSVATERPAPF